MDTSMDCSQQDIRPVWQQQQQYQQSPPPQPPPQQPPPQQPQQQGRDYYGQDYYGQAAKPVGQAAEVVEDDRRGSLLNAKGRPKPNYRPAALRWWYILFLIATQLFLAGLVIYAEQAMRNSDNTAVIQGRGSERRSHKIIHDEAWDRYREGMRLWRRQDATQSPPQVDAQPTPADTPLAEDTPAVGGAQNSPGPPAETRPAPVNTEPIKPTQADPRPENTPVDGDGNGKQTPGNESPATNPPPNDKPADPVVTRPSNPAPKEPQPGDNKENTGGNNNGGNSNGGNNNGGNGNNNNGNNNGGNGNNNNGNNNGNNGGNNNGGNNNGNNRSGNGITNGNDNGNNDKQPTDAPAASTPPDRTQQRAPAATNDRGEKPPAADPTERGAIADAEETAPGKTPSDPDDAEEQPTDEPLPGPESPTPTETEDADGAVARGRITSAWVEADVTSYMTKPGEPTVITTTTEITMTADEVETVTSTRPATTVTPSDKLSTTGTEFKKVSPESPSPEETPNNEYDLYDVTVTTTVESVVEMPFNTIDENGKVVTSTSKSTTTYATTYTTTTSTRPTGYGGGGGGGDSGGGGNVIIQPAATTTFATTYRAGSVKTMPIEITTTGPPIVYAVTGKTTIFSTFTVDPVQGKQILGPTTRTLTSDVPGFLSTIVETPAPVVRTTYGADGLPTAVTETFAPVTRVISVAPSRVVVTDVSTPTALQDLVVVSATTYTLTSTGYYIGKFVPVLAAVVLVLAIRAVDMAAQQYQPFASLAHPQGAAGRDSLTLHFEGWAGFWRPLRLARQGQWVPFLANTAYLLSIAVPSVTSEAIGIKVHGRCSLRAIQGCALNVGVSRLWSYVLAGLLIVTALMLLAVLVVVSLRWRTGVFADPWCVAGAAALARNPDLQSLGAPDFRAVKAAMAEKYYALGWFRNAAGREEYGLVLYDESGRSLRGDRREEGGVAMMPHATYPDAFWRRSQNGTPAKGRRSPRTFAVLTVWWRIVFLIYLLALLGVVLFYHGRRTLVPEKVRWFMEGGNRYGARFITSGLGVVAMIGWDCIFDSIAVVAPYRRMADKPQPASRSALAGRPTYAVTGAWEGIRKRDWLLSLTALMTVISHFLPMLFANVPYNLTQMEAVHTVCSRLSAGLLALMIVVLAAAFLVRWPEMPVDPRSIAGQMWYVAQGSAVESMDGIASLDGRERKRRLERLGGRWTFGMVRTPFGDRMAVELLDFRGTSEYSGHWS